MRTTLCNRVENGRLIEDIVWGTHSFSGPLGAFQFQLSTGVWVRVIASDGRDWDEENLPGPAWEHVSVSLADRCPTWDEMAEVKNLFWLENETVVQFHVQAKEHVNVHRHCLHLWRATDKSFPMPPKECV